MGFESEDDPWANELSFGADPMPSFAGAQPELQSNSQISSPEPTHPDLKPRELPTSAAQVTESGSSVKEQPGLVTVEPACCSAAKPFVPYAMDESLWKEQRCAIGFVPSGAHPLLMLLTLVEVVAFSRWLDPFGPIPSGYELMGTEMLLS